MDTQKTQQVSRNKALIALTAAISCLVIYILACVFSPVTWSPDSSKIAILVTPPGDEPNYFAIFTYDISTGERVLLDEIKLDKVNKDGVLSAPSWSPDGKWIAYYRVEPSPPPEPALDSQVVLNARVLTDEHVNSSKEGKVPEQAGSEEAAEALFSEESKVLPNSLFDLIEESASEQKEKTLNVKLIIVSPDGKEKNVLTVIQFIRDSDTRGSLMTMQPAWSKDSNRLFYSRLVDTDLYYISSLNIDTDEAYVHLFSSTGSFSLSPDGKWIASLLENGSKEFLLNIARVDGTMQKYFKLDLDIDKEQLSLGPKVSWSQDSKHILVPAKEAFGVIDTVTGETLKYSDPNTACWHTFSPDSRKVYYLAIYKDGEPNSRETKIALSSVSLGNRKTKTITLLPKLEGGQLSISPNGKMILIRGVIEDELISGSTLIFWDGKAQTIIETDRWLKTPF